MAEKHPFTSLFYIKLLPDNVLDALTGCNMSTAVEKFNSCCYVFAFGSVLYCSIICTLPKLAPPVLWKKKKRKGEMGSVSLSLTLSRSNTHLRTHTPSLLIKASSVANRSAVVGFLSKKDILIKLQPGNTVIKYECYIRNCQQGFLISI